MNQSDNEDISKWAKTFEESYSPDRRIFIQANTSIKTKLKTDSETFINICAQILMIESKDDEGIKKSKCLASTLLHQILYTNDTEEIDFNKMNINPKQIELLTKAIKSNLFSDINIIGKNCSKCYSSLYFITQEIQSDGINYIINSLKNVSLLPNGFINMIKTMRYILSKLSFQSDIYIQHEVQFFQILILCIKILSEPPHLAKFTIQLRKEACKYIYDLIDLNPSVLNEKGKIGGRISDLLQSLSYSFKIINNKLYTKLYKLLNLLVKKFYTQTPEFLSTILEYLDIGLNLDPSQNSCIISAINFLRDLSENELKIIKSYDKMKITKPLEPLYNEILIDKYLPVCIRFIESIDEKKIEVNDVKNNPRPFMFANEPIASFIKILSEKTCGLIKKKIENYLEKNDKWTFKYAAALLIESINMSNEIHKDILETKYIDILIDFSLQEKVPKLRETALSITKNVFYFMKDEMKIIANLSPFVGLYESILSSDEKKVLNNNNDRILYQRYADFLECLAFVTPFDFNQLNKFCKIMFDIGVINNDELIMLRSSNALNTIIEKTSKNDFSELFQMLNKLYEALNDKKKDKDNTFLIVQACQCSNILHLLKIFHLKHEDLYDQYEHKVFILLCELMENENIYLYRAFMKDIYECITITQRSFNIIMTRFVYKAFSSMDSELIFYTYDLIRDIFKDTNSENSDLHIYVRSILSYLYMIFKNNEMITHQFKILNIIIYIIHNGYNRSNRGTILNLLLKFADIIFNQKINDLEYKCSLICLILCSFGEYYLKSFADVSNDLKGREEIIALEKIISNVLKSIPSIDSINNIMVPIVKKVDKRWGNRFKDIFLNCPSINKIKQLPIYETTDI